MNRIVNPGAKAKTSKIFKSAPGQRGRVQIAEVVSGRHTLVQGFVEEALEQINHGSHPDQRLPSSAGNLVALGLLEGPGPGVLLVPWSLIFKDRL